jgi:hypothetical protein
MSEEKALSEMSNEEIAEVALAEYEAEKSGQEPSEKAVTPEKDTASEEANLESEKPAENQENVDGEKTDEKENLEKPAEKSPSDETEQQKIEAYAIKHKLTVEEAKEDLEKTKSVLEQFKNNPDELAKALRNKDKEYHKLKNEIEKSKPKEPVFTRLSDDQFRAAALQKMQERPAGISPDVEYVHPNIIKYREMYPAKSRYMEDDAIMEEIADVCLQEYKILANQKEHEIKSTSNQKREEMLLGIAENDRKFIPEIKTILHSVDDVAIASGNFDMSYAVYLAKGKKYDEDIKAAEERGYKRAKESANIAGIKTSSAGTSKSTKIDIVGLNEAQKKEALEMYGDNYDSDMAFKLYKETFEDDLKKNKNFLAY